MKTFGCNEKADAASDEVKTAWWQFSDRFAFHFRRLRDDDGLPDWQRMVQSCDTATMLEAIDSIAENWNMERGIPRGTLVRKTYRELWDRKNQTDYASFQCRKCKNTGALWLAYIELRNGEIEPPGTLRKRINDGLVAVFHPSHSPKGYEVRMRCAPVPCVCAVGKKYGSSKNNDIDIAPDADYSEWSFPGQLEVVEWRGELPTKQATT